MAAALLMAALVKSFLYLCLFRLAFVWKGRFYFWQIFTLLAANLVKAPAKAGLHCNSNGGLSRLVGELGPLGGNHKPFVVSGGGHSDSLGVDKSIVPGNES